MELLFLINLIWNEKVEKTRIWKKIHIFAEIKDKLYGNFRSAMRKVKTITLKISLTKLSLGL